MRDAAINHFDSRRYWADSVPLIGAFDPIDAVLDREDSLSERNAFQIGRELGMHRLLPPSDQDHQIRWPIDEMKQGYMEGRQQPARRAGLYQRKLLGLRTQAFRRGIAMSSAITVDYLRDITVEVCPISGVQLTNGTLSGSDWSIDRLENSLGYVPGNVCVMSSRVNQCKGSISFNELDQLARGRFLQDGPSSLGTRLPNGLLVLEAVRLAALMAAPSGLARGMLAIYCPFALAPGAWATVDAAIAGLHVACSRTRIEGPAYKRRLALFKHLGTSGWHTSNRLVKKIDGHVGRGLHPADIWLDAQAKSMLEELREASFTKPPSVDNVDPTTFLESLKAGLAPLAQYGR